MYVFGDLYLRAIEEADLEPLRKMRNHPSTWMNLTDINFITEESQRSWFLSLNSNSHRRYYAVCNSLDALVGLVRMDEIDYANRSARVGCDVIPDYRGKGIGTKIMQGLVQYCFYYLNLHRVWLAVLKTNKRAIRVYKNAGFLLEGRYREAIYRNGRYVDYLLFSLING